MSRVHASQNLERRKPIHSARFHIFGTVYRIGPAIELLRSSDWFWLHEHPFQRKAGERYSESVAIRLAELRRAKRRRV